MRRRAAVIGAALSGLAVLPCLGAPTGALPVPPAQPPTAAPWMDVSLHPDARADLLQAQMTQDEELQLVMGYFGVKGGSIFSRSAPKEFQPLLRNTAGFVPGIPRLGIPALVETDAGVGIANGLHIRPGDEATALTSGLMMAATWNPDLAFSAGAVLGAEARDRGFNVVLDGAMNLVRDPRGGRTFEYAGEDPLLAGSMAGAEVAGVQSRHVISTVKHFALNDQETGRVVLSADIGEAAARESDLLAFEIAIESGDPGAVMCAYNRYNRVYACENDFVLNRVLKHDWSYPGWVLSDWGAVHSTLAAANAGLDQESASGFDRQQYFGAALAEAVADGELAPQRLHDMVHRILRSMFAKGIVDYPMMLQASDVPAHLAVAQQEAEEGIVLLKNAGNVLPLVRDLRNIVVIGAHADLGVLSGGGSSQVIPVGYARSLEFPVGGGVIVLPDGARVMPTGKQVFDPPSPLAAIAAEAPQARIVFETGEDIPHTADAARQADVAIVFAKQWMSEGSDVGDLALPGNQNALIAAVADANPRTIVVLETGGPVLMPWLDKAPAILEAWYAGSGGANAIARVLFGDVNPSGKLPVTFPQSEDQLPRRALPGALTFGAPFDIDYFEGADVGYRWFERTNFVPLFPFGFGLSYSTFHLSNVQTQGGTTIAVAADVTNDGRVEGKKTVQVYVAPPGDEADEMRRLVGWSKVDLKPGETRRISIVADPRLIADFDVDCPCWHIDGDDYTVRAGFSSAALGPEIPVKLDEREIPP
ncbi:MAG: beta-glucosidase family protein [Rhizomicrobium sp.]